MEQQGFMGTLLGSVECIWMTIDFAREFYVYSGPFNLPMEFDSNRIPH